MSKLSIVSATQMSKILRHLGFSFIRQKGSHAFFRHVDGRATAVPIHKGEDLGRGLLRAILRDIDLSAEDFEKIRREI